VKTIGKYKFQLQSRLETSLPGVFAVGDVRAENVKRAATLGEGSIAVASVHQVLHE
jgi:thioredoxin reductase (NADPH)